MTVDDVTRFSKVIERLGMVLGAMYASHLGEVDQVMKAERLSRCGFSNSEIAALLGTTTNAVNVALHRALKSSRKRGSKSAKRK